MVWAILTLLVGLVLLLAEVFIPSGGILGFLSAALLILSLYLAFAESTATGLVFVVIECVAVPVLVSVGFHFLPRTPFGRRLFLASPTPEEIDPAGPKDRSLQALLGQTGRAVTALRPAGLSEIAGRRVDTIAEGVMIDQGQWVRVVAVHGNRVVVRQVDEAQAAPDSLQEPSFDLPSA